MVKSYYRRTPSGGLIRVKGYVKGKPETSESGFASGTGGVGNRAIGPPRPVFQPDPATGERAKTGEYGTPVTPEALRIARQAAADAKRDRRKGDPTVAAALLSTVGAGVSLKTLKDAGVSQEILDILRILLRKS